MKNVYCLYDIVADGWTGQLVTDRADAPVIRMFHDLLADPKMGIGKHANDYEMRCIGSIDDSGELLGHKVVRTVATGAQWLASQTPSLANEA